MDSLDTLGLAPLSRDAAIRLIRKWNTHEYPENQFAAGKNLAREQCAIELLAEVTPVVSTSGSRDHG